jgi:hypothetical protein
MAKDDDIDDQVRKDWEFARRAEELMARLRNQQREPSARDTNTVEGGMPSDDEKPPDE